MASDRIIAYFIHKSDNTFIKSHIGVLDETDSFIIGNATSDQQEILAKKNIVFNLLGSASSTPQQEYYMQQKISGFSGDALSEFPMLDSLVTFPEIEMEEFPGFYRFSVIGPLLQKHTEKLSQIGLTVTEFLPKKNAYVVRITTISQYNQLADQDFVEELRYYGAKDTEIYVRTDKGSEKEPSAIFDILLQDSSDMEGFILFLKDKPVEILEAQIEKVRLKIYKHAAVAFSIAQHPAVRYMYEYLSPKLFNDLAAQIIGTYPAGLPPTAFDFEGKNQIIGVADTGIDNSHPDLINQVIGLKPYGRAGDTSDPHGHGTHVAGSIVGDGSASNGQIKGIAPKAKIYFQSLLNTNGSLSLPLRLQDLFEDAYQKGARIHNNSWGVSTASKYTVNSIEVDDFVYRNKDMLLVFAAGNEGSLLKYDNVPKGDVDFYSIGSPGSAKNVLTVGCSRSSRTSLGYARHTYHQIWPDNFPYPPHYNTELISGDPESLAGFSSRGPCDDERIKPDIVAPGTDIVSTKSDDASLSGFWGGYVPNSHYALMGGTSMSSPIVAGFAALVREFYISQRAKYPSAALLKATIINGCKKLTGRDALLFHPELPNFNQGYGRIDVNTTFPTAQNNIFLHFIDNYDEPARHFINSGENYKFKFKVNSPDKWIRITLAYTDYPARALQNNLNLMVSNKVDLWLGNQNARTMLRGLDSKNNVESILIEGAAVGIYSVQVVASNIIKGPQDFALVLTSSDSGLTL